MTIHSADSPMEVDTHPKRRPVSRVNRQRRKRESTEKPTDLDFAQESAVNEVERILNQTRKILCGGGNLGFLLFKMTGGMVLITFLTHLLSERVEQVMVSRNISTVEASEFVDTLGVDDPSKTYLDGLEDGLRTFTQWGDRERLGYLYHLRSHFRSELVTLQDFLEDSEQVFPLSTPKMYPQWIANASLRETVMKDRHTTMCARVIVLEDFLIELDARIHLYEVRFEEKDLKGIEAELSGDPFWFVDNESSEDSESCSNSHSPLDFHSDIQAVEFVTLKSVIAHVDAIVPHDDRVNRGATLATSGVVARRTGTQGNVQNF